MIRGIICKECGGDLWAYSSHKSQCTNCLAERPYHRRKPGSDISPSQRRKADEIKRFFDGSRFSRDGEPTTEIKWKEELQEETGHLYVSVETGNSVWSRDGGYFKIGRRGGLVALMSYRVGSDKRKRDALKHYAKMLGGKVK